MPKEKKPLLPSASIESDIKLNPNDYKGFKG
jgi:hypothetical protein